MGMLQLQKPEMDVIIISHTNTQGTQTAGVDSHMSSPDIA